MNSLTNLDEILENITKMRPPGQIKHNVVASSLPSTQKSSDILYLTIGIISGILLILILILIAMCVLRLLQRKRLISKSHRSSVPPPTHTHASSSRRSCQVRQRLRILLRRLAKASQSRLRHDALHAAWRRLRRRQIRPVRLSHQRQVAETLLPPASAKLHHSRKRHTALERQSDESSRQRQPSGELLPHPHALPSARSVRGLHVAFLLPTPCRYAEKP